MQSGFPPFLAAQGTVTSYFGTMDPYDNSDNSDNGKKEAKIWDDKAVT